MEEVEGYDPEHRLTLLANCGCLITLATFVACWFAPGFEDPLGGLTLGASSLHAAALGLAFGLPLAACSVAGHSARAKAEFPVLAELHNTQRGLVAPLIAGMSLGQLGALFGFVVMPSLLFLLPGFKAGFDSATSLVSSSLMPSALLGPPLPNGAAAAAAAAAPRLPPLVAAIVPSVLSAYTAGYAVAACLGVRERQISAINDALRSAERYFKLAIAQRTGASASASLDTPSAAAASPDDGAPVAAAAAAAAEAVSAAGAGSEARGRSAAAAFRLVAGVWLLQRYEVSRLGFVLASLEVCFLYITWLATNDLAAPAAAALLHCGVECLLSAREQREVDDAAAVRLRRRAEAAGC